MLSVYIDGSLQCSTMDSSTLSCSWNTRKASSGSHSIVAVAEDAAGNRSETAVSVTTGSSTDTADTITIKTNKGKKK